MLGKMVECLDGMYKKTIKTIETSSGYIPSVHANRGRFHFMKGHDNEIQMDHQRTGQSNRRQVN